VKNNGDKFELSNGSVVIAAITSCTNTSNPSLMLGAGLIAKESGRARPAQQAMVKTSLAPGSKVVTDYLESAGLGKYLNELRFPTGRLRLYDVHRQTAAPLEEHIGAAIKDNSLVAVSVLSGNRNFEGRIHPWCARIIWRRRRSWSPTRWPAAWISTWHRITRQRQKREAGLPCATFGLRRRKLNRPCAPA